MPVQLKREFENVPASWILELRRSVGRLDVSHIARIFEMIENFGRIHIAIVNAARTNPSPTM